MLGHEGNNGWKQAVPCPCMNVHAHVVFASLSAHPFPPCLGIFSLLVQGHHWWIGSDFHAPKSHGSAWIDDPLFGRPHMDRLFFHLIGRISRVGPCDPVHLHHMGVSVETPVVVVVHLLGEGCI